jgi:hypothetical protein
VEQSLHGFRQLFLLALFGLFFQLASHTTRDALRDVRGQRVQRVLLVLGKRAELIFQSG